MNDREREVLERVKARARTISQAAGHFKVPGDEPLTVLALLYLAIKIQGGPADDAILHGPVQCLIKISELLERQAEGVPMNQNVSGEVTLTQEQLHLLLNARDTNDPKGKKRSH